MSARALCFVRRTALPHGVAPERIAATLRCVQERYEVRGVGTDRSSAVVCYEVAALSARVTVVNDAAGGPVLCVTAPLPADAPATLLAERPPRYWELEVGAESPGVDYQATFLVPVY